MESVTGMTSATRSSPTAHGEKSPTGQSIPRPVSSATSTTSLAARTIKSINDLNRLNDGSDLPASIVCDLNKSLETYTDLISGTALGIGVKSFQAETISVTLADSADKTLGEVLLNLSSLQKSQNRRFSTAVELRYVTRCDELFTKMTEDQLMLFFMSSHTKNFTHLPLANIAITQKVLMGLRLWEGLTTLTSLEFSCDNITLRELSTFCTNLRLPKLKHLGIVDTRSVLTQEAVKDLVQRCANLETLKIISPKTLFESPFQSLAVSYVRSTKVEDSGEESEVDANPFEDDFDFESEPSLPNTNLTETSEKPVTLVTPGRPATAVQLSPKLVTPAPAPTSRTSTTPTTPVAIVPQEQAPQVATLIQPADGQTKAILALMVALLVYQVYNNFLRQTQ